MGFRSPSGQPCLFRPSRSGILEVTHDHSKILIPQGPDLCAASGLGDPVRVCPRVVGHRPDETGLSTEPVWILSTTKRSTHIAQEAERIGTMIKLSSQPQREFARQVLFFLVDGRGSSGYAQSFKGEQFGRTG